MAKIFLLILAAFLVYWIFSGRRKVQPPAHREKPASAAEKIVVCAHCQLRVPESEAIDFEGLQYCCEDHRRLAHPD